MSQESMEIVRRIYASLTRADDEALVGLFAPDAVVDFSRRLVEPFVVRLDRKVLASLRHEYLENWSEPPTWEPEELFDTGDKVLAFVRFGARGKASGVEVETHVAHVWKFRDGKPVELKYFGEDRAAGSGPIRSLSRPRAGAANRVLGPPWETSPTETIW